MLPTLHGEFTVVADPELHFAQSGKAIANVRLVANSRKKNDAGEWVDDKTVWVRGSAFGKVAENIVESVQQGSRVMVTGRLVTDEWPDKDTGEKRSRTGLLIEKFGVDLMFDPARSMKREAQQAQAAQKNDPWKEGGGKADSEEPPF